MILFIVFDPSTKNTIKPIYEIMLKKYPSHYIDLNNDIINYRIPYRMVISCFSTNKIEFTVFRKFSCKKIMIIDGPLGSRFDNVSKKCYPDKFIVSNRKVCNILNQNFNIDYSKMIISGSIYLDWIFQNHKKNLEKNNSIPFFLPADDPNIDYKLTQLSTYENIFTNLINYFNKTEFTIILRPHPRSSKILLNLIDNYSKNYEIFKYHEYDNIDNYTIINSSKYTFSVGSFSSYESIVLGTPSCFLRFNIHFPGFDRYVDIQNMPVINNENDLNSFIMFKKMGKIDDFKDAIQNTINFIKQQINL